MCRGSAAARIVVLLVAAVVATPTAVVGASVAKADTSWRDCRSLIVANGEAQTLPSLTVLTALEQGTASPDAVALFVKARHERCATAWALASAALQAPDESTALDQRGFRVRSVRRLGSLPLLGPAYQLVASRGRAAVRYVRLGRLGFGGSLGGQTSAGPSPPKRAGCRRYEVIGVRGSGEAYAGPFGMADTVGATAIALVDALPRKSVRTTSLRYPAAPVSELLVNNGAAFYLSMEVGTRALVRRIRDVVRRCSGSRIALIGYSQGAAVASEGVRRILEEDFDERARRALRAVVLYADPYSAGAGSSYDVSFTPAGEPTSYRPGHGALGGRGFELGVKLYRVRDVCFVADLVCDLPDGVVDQLITALYAPVHSGYKDCCRGFPLTRVLGRWASRLMQRR